MSNEDKFSWHEALDRTHIVISMLSDHVTAHPVILGNPELAKLAETAENALAILYQRIGSVNDADDMVSNAVVNACPHCGEPPKFHGAEHKPGFEAICCENDSCPIMPGTEYMPIADAIRTWNNKRS